jgi:8-oxo-dGTP diphosphatase
MDRKNLDSFFTYSFSSDCVIFSYKDGQIMVLVIKRDVEPFNEKWAIPGSLLLPEEDPLETAQRTLFELTNLTDIVLHQGETFGKPNRPTAERVITCAYYILLRQDAFSVESSSFAKKLAWIPIHEIPKLAFDHNLILNSTYSLLKQKLAVQPVCFELLPKNFTLSELQSLYEYTFEKEMDKANFRKKIKSIPLIPHSEKQKNVNHRPASLFSFDEDTYQRLVSEKHYTFRMY